MSENQLHGAKAKRIQYYIEKDKQQKKEDGVYTV